MTLKTLVLNISARSFPHPLYNLVKPILFVLEGGGGKICYS